MRPHRIRNTESTIRPLTQAEPARLQLEPRFTLLCERRLQQTSSPEWCSCAREFGEVSVTANLMFVIFFSNLKFRMLQKDIWGQQNVIRYGDALKVY